MPGIRTTGLVQLVTRFSIMFLGVLLGPLVSHAATYYVGASATGAGTGTSASNLCGGLADADCTPSAGDTVYLCGAFTTQLAPQAVNGSAGSPITYDFNCPGNPATLTFDGSADRGLFISGRAYLTVNDARVTGVTGSGGATDTALLSVLTSTNIVLNRPITYGNTASRGLSIRNSSDVTVYDLISYGNNGHGAWITNTSTRITIAGFTTYNNTRTGLKFEGNATQASMSYSEAYDGLTYNNGDGCYAQIADHITLHDIISHDNTDQSNGGEGYGCGIQQVTNLSFYGNVLYENRTDGVEVWGDASLSSANCLVRGNFIYGHTHYTADDSGSNGIEVATGYAPGCQVIGNVLVGNTKNIKIGQDPTGASILAHNTIVGGIYSLRLIDSNVGGVDAVTGWQIVNNLFDTPSSDWIYTAVTSGNSNTIRKNAYVGGKQVTYNNVVYTASTITTVDASATTSDPTYTGTSVGAQSTVASQYRQAPASLLTRAGVAYGACVDYRLRVCPSGNPDIGAYQSSSGDPRAN